MKLSTFDNIYIVYNPVPAFWDISVEMPRNVWFNAYGDNWVRIYPYEHRAIREHLRCMQ